MSKPAKTALEKRYHGVIAEMGCLVCGSQANVHHIREERIKSHWLVIPLCKDHHQGDFSIHNSKRQFENIYGSELDLMAATISKLFEGLSK